MPNVLSPRDPHVIFRPALNSHHLNENSIAITRLCNILRCLRLYNLTILSKKKNIFAQNMDCGYSLEPLKNKVKNDQELIQLTIRH